MLRSHASSCSRIMPSATATITPPGSAPRWGAAMAVRHMQGDARIREAIDRNVRVVSAHPGVAKGTAKTTAVLHPGLDCTVTEGPFELKVGMTEKYGGRG